MRRGSFRDARITIFIALLMGLTLGAYAQAKLDASQLLTKEEVGKLAGASVIAVKPGGDGRSNSTATYITADGSPIVFLVQMAKDEAGARAIFDKNRDSSKASSGVDPQAVTGLGDRAFWSGGDAKTLAVMKGKYWLSITAPLMDSPLEPAKQMAAMALKRLP